MIYKPGPTTESNLYMESVLQVKRFIGVSLEGLGGNTWYAPVNFRQVKQKSS